MARTKRRSIDLVEIEARVEAVDKSKRRSYDPFDLEQRIYNIEANGGGGGGDTSKIKTGTFTTENTQYGLSEIDCGFKPDLVVVFLPISQKDTTSYWEKNASWAATSAIWCIKPAENAAYEVTLGRTTGETGIQSITDTGFKFIVNGSNTRNIECKYVAVNYGS